jgi:hypothetical protein
MPVQPVPFVRALQTQWSNDIAAVEALRKCDIGHNLLAAGIAGIAENCAQELPIDRPLPLSKSVIGYLDCWSSAFRLRFRYRDLASFDLFLRQLGRLKPELQPSNYSVAS